MRELLKKYRAQIGDSAFGIFGLVFMNAVAQLLLFPLYAKRFGEVGYGNLQYLMAYVNILTVAVGSAANYARITAHGAKKEHGGDYNLFLLLAALVGLPFTYLVRRFSGAPMDNATYICYYLLFVAMTFRYYADVSYKITLSYRRYFLYYAVIGAGYALGTLLMWHTGIWPLGLLVGEAAGVLFAYLTASNLRRGGFRPSPVWKATFGMIFTLLLAEGASNLILNADRLLLGITLGASAVAIYYLATLTGKTMSLLTVPLGGVLIGYLARYEGRLDRRTARRLLFGSLAAVLGFSLLCTLGGALVIRLLYPLEFDTVLPYLPIGSLAEVLYFITGILTTVLLRFGKRSYQIAVGAVFAVAFLALGIPATLAFGLWGFAAAAAIAGLFRWGTAICLIYFCTRQGEAACES